MAKYPQVESSVAFREAKRLFNGDPGKLGLLFPFTLQAKIRNIDPDEVRWEQWIHGGFTLVSMSGDRYERLHREIVRESLGKYSNTMPNGWCEDLVKGQTPGPKKTSESQYIVCNGAHPV